MRHRFHAICPYFAMFPELFVQKHLIWSKPGDLVFDPFSGRGTTVFESLLNNRRAVGCDINPVAVCISKAKTQPPELNDALKRVKELENAFKSDFLYESSIVNSDFFSKCFSHETLNQILYLRRSLKWQSDICDCFISAIALGCLHGESHRSGRYFSNRMPRTISTKPDYSIRWWDKHGYVAPDRDVFTILKSEIEYRYVTPPPERHGFVAQGDVRHASDFLSGMKGEVSLLITSPPYLDTTNFAEDQWLRIWFLGGKSRPDATQGKDDRYSNRADYWNFLTEAWRGIRDLLKDDAHLVVRMGGSKLGFEETTMGLQKSIEDGLGCSINRIEARVSEINKGQLRSFRPNAEGTKVEFDYHFSLF